MNRPRPDLVVRGAAERPRVSIIIPVFNAGSCLQASVDSALRQSLPDLEVLIVDDASRDRSLEIARALAHADDRISVLRFTRNVGQATARNAAIEVSRGKWITPLDADDEMTEQRLATLCDLADSTGADFVADMIRFVDPGEIPTLHRGIAAKPISFDLRPQTLTLEAMIESDIPLNGQCSYGFLKPVMRRSFLEQRRIRYDHDLRFAEDLNLYLKGLIHGARFLLVPEAHYFYKQTPVSASRGIKILPSTADQALVNHARLRAMLTEQGITGLDALLDEHRERWELVLWFNRVKSALRHRRAIDALRLGLDIPGGSRAFARFAHDRWSHDHPAAQKDRAAANHPVISEGISPAAAKSVI